MNKEFIQQEGALLKKTIAKWLVVAAGSIMAFMGSYAHAAELRLGTLTPPGQVWTKNAEKLANEFNERTNQHTITVFPSAQLGNEADMLQQLQTGVLDLAFITVSELANRVPELNAFFAPYLVESNEQAARFLSESDSARQMLDLLTDQVGVRGLAYGMGGVTQVMTVGAAKGVDGLKGKKVRITPSPAIRDWDQILGATPVPLSLPALYDATVNGQVDALELNLEMMNLGGYDDITSSLLLTHQSIFPMVVLVSEKAWSSFNEEDRALLSEVGQKYADSILQETVEAETKALNALRERGKVEVIVIDPETQSEAIKQWDEKWLGQAPNITEFRKEAKNYRVQ